MPLVTGGLGGGPLVTGGLGGFWGGAPPPPPPPIPIAGGGGGGAGGGRGWFPEQRILGCIDDDDVLCNLDMLDFDPPPLAEGLGIDPESEGVAGAADVTGPPIEEQLDYPPPTRRRAPQRQPKAVKKKGPSKGFKRAAKVAAGAGSIYFAGKGLSQTVDAAQSGDVVKLVKGLMKLQGVRRLGETGVQQVLDGLTGDGEDDDEDT